MSFYIQTAFQNTPQSSNKKICVPKKEVPNCPIHFSTYIAEEDAYAEGCPRCEERRDYVASLSEVQDDQKSVAVPYQPPPPPSGGMMIYVDPKNMEANGDFF